MALFDEFFEQLAEHLGGASVDQIKVIFVLVSSYPAALGIFDPPDLIVTPYYCTSFRPLAAEYN
ncbi:45745_t:CDS:2, partial [Gigaspora margarita]